MQIHGLALCLLTLWFGHGAADDHPVSKVITLLQDLMAQAKTEGQEEEVSYQKFVYWCQTSSAELSKAIKEEKETIETLQSTVDGKTVEIEILGGEITKLENEITTLEAADSKATEDRSDSNKLYTEKEQDLKDTISAIGEAITALEDAATTTDSGLFLLHHRQAQKRVRDVFALIATIASAGQQQSLMKFVSTPDDTPTADDTTNGAQAVAAENDYNSHVKKYNFKSDSVTELLKGLKLKFEDELTAATVAETNAVNAFSLSKKARDATKQAATDSKSQKETDKADAEGELSTAQGSLTDEKADLAADSGALSSTEESCNMKKSEWQERSAIRVREAKAMEQAIKILAAASGVRTEAPSNPVPPPSPVSFLQTLNSNDPQTRAVKLLKATAKTYHSKSLERLAAQVATVVPKQFQAVINQIEKMIFRLQQEQVDEDNHKAWCDMEVSKTETSLSNKQDKMDELDAKINEGKARVATLTTEIQEADTMMKDIRAYQAEATEIRQAGKQENELAIKDAVSAQRAITNAISVLQEFYKSTGQIPKEPWEFLQKSARQPTELSAEPDTWSSSYSGVADPQEAEKGVISVLEATSGQFAQMEANTRSQEVTDQQTYDEEMKKNGIELARREKESEMKSEEKKRLLQKVADLTSQHKHVSDEHYSTEQYEKDLQKACVDGDSTYEDRKAARAAEVQALKDAQGILDKAFDESAGESDATLNFMAKKKPAPKQALRRTRPHSH
jgi:hypothetical protein